ncbi:unnamed protein product [Rotaria sp. Silwood2]|nr:unnamed protein product [Rotaria sp. Silwood2]CAF4433317.1 unnamed protein product [Rotaria sp. Silwood2]
MPTENLLQKIRKHEKFKLFAGLQNIAQSIRRVYSLEECVKLLRKLSNQSVFLVISSDAPLNEESHSKLCCFLNVEYIYYFGSDQPWKKTIGDVSDGLICFSQEESGLNILPSNVESTKIKNLDAETQRFAIRQLLIELLHRYPCTSEAIQDFLAFCRSTCKDDPVRLNQIRKFENDYRSEQAIWWYTKDTFIFRVLNQTLRCCNLSEMFKIRSYITDLYLELKRLYFVQLPMPLCSILRLYRGKVIPKEEFDHLKKSSGKLAIVNSFLSTSLDKTVAISYAGQGVSESTGNVSVVFCMHNNIKANDSKPIALIDRLSQKLEEEVLISTGFIFRIGSIEKLGVSLSNVDIFE